MAVDHNLLTMITLHKVAHRHKLKALFHEKPFHGINGSGKHCNWSMSTDTGINLLDPTSKPEANPVFMTFLVATINAVYKHSALLRCGIASASNDHRLGGNEAPPSIISVFMGDHLNEVLNAVEEGREVQKKVQPHITSIKVGGTVLDVKVKTLPEIARDLTDRNRTSPFAFTGNKFEFRAVGAKQSPSFPVALLNAAAAASMKEITAAIETKTGGKRDPTTDEVFAVLKEFIKKTKNIRFEGDGYSAEWHAEAAKRGLPNFKNSTEAFKALLDEKHKTMLTKTTEVFSEAELDARYHVLTEKYSKELLIEANTLKSIVLTSIIPTAFEYRKFLAESSNNLKNAGVSADPEKNVLKTLGDLTVTLQGSAEKLGEAIDVVVGTHDGADTLAAEKLLPVMRELRDIVDRLEQIIPDKSWPFPKYTELLFSI